MPVHAAQITQCFRDIKLVDSNLNIFLDPSKVPNLQGLNLKGSTLNIFPAEILTQRPAQVNAAILASKGKSLPLMKNPSPMKFIDALPTGEILGEVSDQEEGKKQRKNKVKRGRERRHKKSQGFLVT
jgi:hypothetical protein